VFMYVKVFMRLRYATNSREIYSYNNIYKITIRKEVAKKQYKCMRGLAIRQLPSF